MRKFITKHALTIILAITTIGFAYLFFTVDKETVTVPIAIKVPVPEKVSTFPPIESPTPKKTGPTPKVDNIPEEKKDSILSDALTVREYEETFEDDNTTSIVKSKVKGELLSQSLETIVKADTINHVANVNVEVPVKPTIIFDMTTGVPLNNTMKVPLNLGGTFISKKKKLGYRVQYDFTNKIVTGGVAIKF